MSYRSDQYMQFSTYVTPVSPRRVEWDDQVHVHTCEELFLIPRPGTCTVINNGNNITIPTPAFIWNRAGSYHCITDISDKADAFVATYHPQVIASMPKQLLKMDFMEDNGMFALPLNWKHSERLLALFNALCGSPYFQRQLLFPCIFHQVSQALAAGMEPIRSGNAYGYIFKVISLLQTVGPERLTTDDIAAKFHVGKTKLKADFKKITNTPIHTYRLRQQLRAARTKMVSSKVPLAEIAMDCGFTDESHLIRAFRAEYGLTPGVFRRKYMGDFKKAERHSNYNPG